MTGWSEYYEWTRDQVMKVVRGRNHVVLDCEHNSAHNMRCMVQWLEEAGYACTIPEHGECIIVDRK